MNDNFKIKGFEFYTEEYERGEKLLRCAIVLELKNPIIYTPIGNRTLSNMDFKLLLNQEECLEIQSIVNKVRKRISKENNVIIEKLK